MTPPARIRSFDATNNHSSCTDRMRAVRHRRESDDAFFSNGDQVSLYDSSPQVVFCIEESIIDSMDSDLAEIHSESGDTTHKDAYRQSFPCPVVSCNLRLQSISEFQTHYETNHVHQCSVCFHILHSNHLLDLHIQEKHDSYFITALEKGRAFYCCLSSSCACTFDDENNRLHHLQHVHGYPRWFRFHPRANKNKDPRAHNHSTKKENRKSLWKQKNKESSLENNMQGISSRDVEMFHVSGTEPNPRNERRRIKNSTIPCKYHSGGKCWRGSRCMFLHSDLTTQADGTTDIVVDELTQQFHSVTPFEGGVSKRKPRINLHL